MHFWINKPVGRSRVIGGCTRYHSSSIPASIPLRKIRGLHLSRGRPERLGPSSMISLNPPLRPIHWSSTTRSCDPSYRNTALRLPSQQLRHEQIERPPRRQLQTSTIINNNVINPGPRTPRCGECTLCVVPNETDSTRVNHGVFPTSENGDNELVGNRLLCGIWITFVLATGFVSFAKFCFSNRPDACDLLIVSGLLVALLVSGCFYVALVRRARIYYQNNNPHDFHTRTLSYYQHPPRASSVLPDIEVPVSPAPPPYHIAIQVFPPAETADLEDPPPSYEKATNPHENSIVQQV